jgi:hypothetical protein
MTVVRLLPLVAASALLGGAAGCGGNSRYAKVSGVVTLDGKPYKNAIVSFQPMASGKNPNPGRGSTGLTDENGRYSLTTDDGHTGAVVGKHRIRIRTKVDDPGAVVDPSVGSSDDPFPKGKKVEIEPIPQEWFADHTTKEFEVPPGGTDQANFDIVTKPGARKH